MEHRSQATNPIDLPSGAQAPEDSPLRSYLAALDQGEEGRQLLRQIGVYVDRAGLGGDQPLREIALEVLSETVVQALRAENRFDASRSAKAWLLGIASNVILQRRQKFFRQKQHETLASNVARPDDLSEEQLFDRLVVLAHVSPEQELLAKLEIEELLAPLSPDDRRVITLNVLDEMNGKEVAEALETTPGNARVRLARALKKLRASRIAQRAGQEEKHSHE